MNPKLDQGQIKAIQELNNGNILCGETGSGKSRAGLAYYFCKVCGGIIDGKNRGYERDYVPMKKPLDLYIITTAKKRDKKEWEDEMSPFLLSTDPEINYYKDKMIVVVDSWNNIIKYGDVIDSFFIFDEQRVVSYGAWSKTFIKISKHNQWIFLSATPGDTWMDYMTIFIANGFFRNKTDFVNRHVMYSRYSKFPKVDQYLNERILERMRDSILVNIDYVKPTERHEIELIVEYNKNAYKELMKTRWDSVENKPISNISKLCYMLRQIVNSDPSRIEECLKIAEDHAKIIIFYNFDYELEILRNAAWPEGTVVREWNGHKHEEIIDADRWVYLVQYSAGAEGWNCTQTDTLVFYSPSYSYKSTEQAKGRIDRRNTKFKDLYYYSFRSFAPIDIAIRRALKRKRNFNESQFFKS